MKFYQLLAVTQVTSSKFNGNERGDDFTILFRYKLRKEKQKKKEKAKRKKKKCNKHYVTLLIANRHIKENTISFENNENEQQHNEKLDIFSLYMVTDRNNRSPFTTNIVFFFFFPSLISFVCVMCMLSYRMVFQ